MTYKEWEELIIDANVKIKAIKALLKAEEGKGECVDSECTFQAVLESIRKIVEDK